MEIYYALGNRGIRTDLATGNQTTFEFNDEAKTMHVSQSSGTYQFTETFADESEYLATKHLFTEYLPVALNGADAMKLYAERGEFMTYTEGMREVAAKMRTVDLVQKRKEIKSLLREVQFDLPRDAKDLLN